MVLDSWLIAPQHTRIMRRAARREFVRQLGAHCHVTMSWRRWVRWISSGTRSHGWSILAGVAGVWKTSGHQHQRHTKPPGGEAFYSIRRDRARHTHTLALLLIGPSNIQLLHRRGGQTGAHRWRCSTGVKWAANDENATERFVLERLHLPAMRKSIGLNRDWEMKITAATAAVAQRRLAGPCDRRRCRRNSFGSSCSCRTSRSCQLHSAWWRLWWTADRVASHHHRTIVSCNEQQNGRKRFSNKFRITKRRPGNVALHSSRWIMQTHNVIGLVIIYCILPQK